MYRKVGLPVAIEIALPEQDAAGDGMLEYAGFERLTLPREQARQAHVKGYHFHSDYQTTLEGRAMQFPLNLVFLCELGGSSWRSLRLESLDSPQEKNKNI
jgi:hypothetical protein